MKTLRKLDLSHNLLSDSALEKLAPLTACNS